MPKPPCPPQPREPAAHLGMEWGVQGGLWAECIPPDSYAEALIPVWWGQDQGLGGDEVVRVEPVVGSVPWCHTSLPLPPSPLQDPEKRLSAARKGPSQHQPCGRPTLGASLRVEGAGYSETGQCAGPRVGWWWLQACGGAAAGRLG